MADNPRIEDLRRRVQKDPASIAFAQLAEEYRRAGQFREAVDACRTGLSQHPGYLSARVTLGRVLLELGDLEAAERELQTVLKSASENLAAVRGMADIHYKRNELGQALEFYRKALTLARNDPELDQIVADLSKRVTPGPRKEPADGLSLEQVQREISARVQAQPERPAAKSAAKSPETVHGKSSESAVRRPAPAPPLAQGLRLSSTPDASRRTQQPISAAALHAQAAAEAAAGAEEAARDRTVRVVAALEQWLDAIHAARSRRAS
jgi:tetratricopeptide (TPR) repeat protein